MKYIKRFLFISVICFIALTVGSCNEKKQTENTEPIKENSLINPIYFDNIIQYNFGVDRLFNSKFIQKNKIQEIEYSQFLNDEKVRTQKFSFTKSGSLISCAIDEFLDKTKISTSTYYFGENAQKTFQNPIVEYNFNIIDFNDFSPKSQAQYFKTIDDNKDFTHIKNTTENYSMFYLKNPKIRNPIVIDSIFNSKKEDVFIYGTMEKPIKKFNIENIVLEKNVVKYRYNKEKLVAVNFEKLPFTKKRRFNYKNGTILSMTDSVLVNKDFLQVDEYSFFYKNNKVHKIHSKRKNQLEENLSNLELKFKYKFYEND